MGSSSTPKSDPLYDADAGGETETNLDYVIPDSPTKSIGLTPLSSPTVTPNSSSKGASIADPTGAHKCRFRPSVSSSTIGIPLLSSPKKACTSCSSSNRGLGVTDTTFNLPPITFASSDEALREYLLTSDPVLVSVLDLILSSPEAPPTSSEAIVYSTPI